MVLFLLNPADTETEGVVRRVYRIEAGTSAKAISRSNFQLPVPFQSVHAIYQLQILLVAVVPSSISIVGAPLSLFLLRIYVKNLADL